MTEEIEVPETIEQRLQKHAKAFESLMALAPAREYFGSQIDDGLEPSEQWNRKKQTKEQKRAAKKAKLDPANQKSALDVMKEHERKRKRELGEEGGEEGGVGGEDAEEKTVKKPKVEHDEGARRRQKAERRKEKRQVKKEKMERKKVKADAKKAAKQDQDLDEALAEKREAEAKLDEDDDQYDEDDTVVAHNNGGELDGFDASGLAEDDTNLGEDTLMDDAHSVVGSEASSAPSTAAVDSPAFDVATNHSAASSSSSIVPPSLPEQTKQSATTKPAKPTVDTTAAQAAIKKSDPTSGTSSPKIQLPNIDQAQLQERLRQRIEELRARRKADGPEGKPAKSRQDLLEQRRKKEEQRKAAKKEQRRQAKDDEQWKREEQLRGSGSPMSMDMFSPRTQENNFSFSRLAFEDGTSADPTMSTLADPRKKKGPQDPRTALEAAQKKQARISGLDAEKRADIADKDMWLNAKKRAHGERVRDDTSLLKKALKRKEKGKSKSEKAWQEREENVVKGREMKQKKREANLAKRKEDKGGNKGGKKGPQKGGAKKGGKRPGFEGRFKA
ncbi:hypothetical protein LTR78_005693 [Recurvomyces mirabilis]|uniref:SURF6-domain-containing protein n=1 Tax=Recurvomyces mirabilis TaxID=574656 RepID=A0AAE1C1N0_9PEZI|nr:hypothetical protein LTR78_005693 [Recurvomyces mirabilis]KAK5151184.1 hypothetical protein LTS14_009354 [Recurvomyces mirabilis]